MHNLPNKKVIHKWAVASAATAAVFPVPFDAVVLTSEEIMMVVHVAALFGHAISKRTAKQAIATGALGFTVGTFVFEGLDVGYPVTIPLKIAVATTVMETLGNVTYEYYAAGKSLET